MSDRPLAIDLFTGLHGWSSGLVAAGWSVIGFDIEDMCGQFGVARPENVHLVLQDVLTIDGAQFRDARLIVASPPCQEFSYMAMPWTRAKQIARALRGEDEFPDCYLGSRSVAELTALFDACFRIQREASAAAGRHIPMVVENVRGAQPWVGRARWNYGSFFLWGDVPALMPITYQSEIAAGVGTKNNGGSWFNIGSPGQKVTGRNPVHELSGIKGFATNGGPLGKNELGRRHGSKSKARKEASARIAKIPCQLAIHVGRVFLPERAEEMAGFRQNFMAVTSARGG